MITYVSAFYDIGRSEWKHFKRSFDEYLESFIPFISLFKKADKQDHFMILFMDVRYTDKIKDIIKDIDNIKLIHINYTFLQLNIPMWRYLDREREIMNTQQFQNMVLHRKNCPECYIPEYTVLNHCKIDFICYVINREYTDSNYCWVDFGYFKHPENIPEKLLDENKLDSNRITYTLINKVEYTDNDISYLLTHAPEKIGGFFFYGGKSAMLQYQLLYHNMVLYYQYIGLADDDQSMALMCYFRNPMLFNLIYTGQWHYALVYFK